MANQNPERELRAECTSSPQGVEVVRPHGAEVLGCTQSCAKGVYSTAPANAASVLKSRVLPWSAQTRRPPCAMPAPMSARVAQDFSAASVKLGDLSELTTQCTWLVRTLSACSCHSRSSHVLAIARCTWSRAGASKSIGALFILAFRRLRSPSSREIRGSPNSLWLPSTDPRASPWSQVPYVRNVRK